MSKILLSLIEYRLDLFCKMPPTSNKSFDKVKILYNLRVKSMLFFGDTVLEIKKLFDPDATLDLSTDEKKILERKLENHLKEGISFWTANSGVYSNKGQIQFRKIISDKLMLPTFLGDLTELLSFPGVISIDFHGLLKSPEGNLIYKFASQNSGIKLDSTRNFVRLEDSKTLKALSEKLRTTDYSQYLEKWFDSHDVISDLSSSGLRPERLLCVLVYFEPTSHSVSDLFGLKSN